MNYSKDHPFVLFIDEYSFLRSYDVKIGKTYKGEIDFVVMKDGKIVETGKTEEVLKNPKSEYTKLLIASVPTLESEENYE